MHSLRAWDAPRFADLLADLISATGLSQQELAERAAVSHSQISRWKNGQHKPTHDSLARLYDVISSEHPDAADIVAQMMDAAGYESRLLPGLTAAETRAAMAYIAAKRAEMAAREEKSRGA